jgi:hypothetical protein
MLKKAVELCGERTFDDLGLRLGTSAGTGNLEDSEVLVESDQRLAADRAAVASVMVLSLSRRRGWTYLEMQRRPWLRRHRV